MIAVSGNPLPHCHLPFLSFPWIVSGNQAPVLARLGHFPPLLDKRGVRGDLIDGGGCNASPLRKKGDSIIVAANFSSPHIRRKLWRTTSVKVYMIMRGISLNPP